MNGYPWKSTDININIHKSMDNWRLISIKTKVSIKIVYAGIHCIMALHGYPCLDINVDIHICMDNWRLTSKNHGYPCWYPWIFGNACMDGYAMDSRTRGILKNSYVRHLMCFRNSHSGCLAWNNTIFFHNIGATWHLKGNITHIKSLFICLFLRLTDLLCM